MTLTSKTSRNKTASKKRNKPITDDINIEGGFDREETKKRRFLASHASRSLFTDSLSDLNASQSHSEKPEEYYNRLLEKLGIRESPEVKRLKEQFKEKQKNEKNNIDFLEIKSLLEEQVEDIRKLKAEYLEVVKKNMRPYIGYPANDDYSKYKEEAKNHALEEDKKIAQVNQAISFLAEDICKQMLPKVTKDSEFRKAEKLASGIGNAQKSLKDIETIASKLEMLKQSSQSPEYIQRCWVSIKRELVGQIEIAHQRWVKAEKEHKLYEGAAKQLERHVNTKEGEKVSNEYKEPIVSDTLRNTRERADNAKNRIEQAEKQGGEVKNRVEQAKKRLEEWNKEKSIDDIQKKYHNAKEEAEQAKREVEQAEDDKKEKQNAIEVIKQARDAAFKSKIECEINGNSEKAEKHASEIEKCAALIKQYAAEVKRLDAIVSEKTEDYNKKKIKYDEAKAKYEKAKKEADEAQKKAELAAKFGIDTSKLYESTNNVHKCAEDLALLYTKCVGYAKSVLQIANNAAIEIEKNPEQSAVNSMISSEDKRFKLEMEVMSEIKDKQAEEIKTLENQKKIVSECIEKIKGGNKTANDSSENEKIEDKVKLNKQLKEHLENFTAWGKEIDKGITDARSRFSEIEKQLEEAKKLESQYGALTSGQTEKEEVQAERAKNLAEQYHERAERSLDRVKHYEKYAKSFERPIKEGEESPVNFAKQMAEKEQAISNAYRDLACSKDELAKASQGDKDKSSADDAVKEAQSKIAEAEKNINNLLTQLDQLYKKEKASIEEYEAKIREYSESAKTDEKKLQKIRKNFEENQSEKIDGINVDGILKNNKSYLENKIEYNAKKAIDKLDQISKHLREQDIEHVVDSSEAHVFLDAANSGFIVINGVCMDMKEIRSFKYDKEKGITTIVWREDIPQITIFGDKKYTKRLSYFEINTNRKTVTIGIPGNRYRDGERSKGIVTFKNQGFEGAVIEQAPISQEGQKDEDIQKNNEAEKEYKMREVKSINVVAYEKHKGDIEVGSLVEIKTMPSDVIEHKDSVKCYRRDMLQNMHRLNLRKNKYFSPNNHFSLDLGDFDYTETRVDKTKGLSFVEEWTFRMANLEEIAKMSFYLKDGMKQKGEDMTREARNHQKEAIEGLKWAIGTLNQDVIDSTFQLVKEFEGKAESEAFTMLKQIRHHPANQEHFERMNESSENCIDALLQADSQAGQEAAKARYALNDELRQHILAIHQKYPLMLEDVLRYDQGKNSLENHPSSEKKKELLESIYKAYELDKTYSFQLLVDPNKGGEVKCSTPDALMLLEEYDKYENKSLSKEEQQYIKNMENFVNDRTDDNYLKNAINLKIAIKAAKNGKDLNGVFTALGRLCGGDNVDPDNLERLKKKAYSSKEDLEEYLKALRQNDEYHWVDYIDKSIKNARAINEQIYGPLQTVASMQKERLRMLKLAKETLSPDTPSDLAIKKLENSSLSDKRSLCKRMAKVDIQSKKKDSHFEQEVDEITNRLMEKGNPEEYAKQEVRLAWKEASKVFRDLVESLPNQKKELEAHAGDFLKLMSKQYLDAFNRALAIRIHGMREKLMDKSMKHEILVIAVTNGYCQLGQFQSRIGNLFMRLLTDIEKIAGIG